MATQTQPTSKLRQRAVNEFKEFAIVAIYLYITLGAVILMKTAVLHSHGIDSAPWGIAIVKSLLLAKFMLLGDAMKIGERSTARPLIWPTLYKAGALLLLLVILSVLEDAIVGLFHHQSIATSLGELAGPRLWETAVEILIILLVLIPYCAFRTLDVALGEGRLTQMFFVKRETTPP